MSIIYIDCSGPPVGGKEEQENIRYSRLLNQIRQSNSQPLTAAQKQQIDTGRALIHSTEDNLTCYLWNSCREKRCIHCIGCIGLQNF